MKLIKKILLFILVIVILVVGYVTYEGFCMYKDALEVSPLETKVATIKSNADYMDFDSIPEDYRDAVVAVEDHRFYSHLGIDIISIGRAVIDDIKAKALVSGGSTITQQLCKNVYFSQEKKFTRKVAEVFMALKFEDNYSKNDILEMYINTCYFGSGYYGIYEASTGFYNKKPTELSLYECSLLAGIPNAPSVYSLKVNPSLAIQRQKVVIDAMSRYGYITKDEATSVLEKE